MTIRLATAADAPAIAQVANDFWAEAGVGAARQTASKIAARIKDPNIVVVFDELTHAYGEVKNHGREFEVGIFPRTVSRGVLLAVLDAVLAQALLRFPTFGARRIWGWFPGGRDAQGARDGGRELAFLYQQAFPGAQVAERGGRWEISWDLASAAAAGRMRGAV